MYLENKLKREKDELIRNVSKTVLLFLTSLVMVITCPKVFIIASKERHMSIIDMIENRIFGGEWLFAIVTIIVLFVFCFKFIDTLYLYEDYKELKKVTLRKSI